MLFKKNYHALFLILALDVVAVLGFLSSLSITKEECRSLLCPLSALSERQMQFWEDVEDGLNEIEKSFEGERINIDRVREFTKSASGEIPPPIGLGPYHQPCEEYIDGLTANPFWDVTNNPDLFPWAAELESQADIICEEYIEKLKQRELFAGDSVWQNQVMGTGWSAVRLRRLGVWNAPNCAEFPKTYNILQSLDIPFAVRGVCFARQVPGSGVQPHSDGRNFILTSQLGLQVPSEGECWIKVGSEQRSWVEGKLTTLDTSFEHSTANMGKTDRHILIIDFWHPELSVAEQTALNFVYDLRNKFESGQIPIRTPRRKKYSVANNTNKGKSNDGLVGLWNILTGQK